MLTQCRPKIPAHTLGRHRGRLLYGRLTPHAKKRHPALMQPPARYFVLLFERYYGVGSLDVLVVGLMHDPTRHPDPESSLLPSVKPGHFSGVPHIPVPFVSISQTGLRAHVQD
jgi:hypothetical protein